jgi:uroporphyrinogen-III synthase
MQKNRINILSTRPLSESIISEAAQQNIFIDCISFIETEPVKNPALSEKLQQLSSKNIEVVFTSMNAVEAVKDHLRFKPNWKIFSIGQTTKELIKEFFGENSVVGTADDASQLANVIMEHHPKEVFFFCGDQRRDEMPQKLNEAGITLEEIVVYKTSSTSKKLNTEYDGVLFFSPSAVDSFFITNTVASDAIVFAIGNTTAAAVIERVNNKIVIADKPGKEELVKKMLAYLSPEKQKN